MLNVLCWLAYHSDPPILPKGKPEGIFSSPGVDVLKRMLEDGYITEAQDQEANQEEPKIVTQQNPNLKAAPDFVENVREYVEVKYGADALYKEGLQVYTTVDLDKTKIAQAAMDAGLRELDKRQGYRGPLKTLTVKEVMEFLEERTRSREQPLEFGDITEGVVTHIDAENIYVRMGSYVNGTTKKEYVGQIKVDPNPKWWVRQPFLIAERRTRNFAHGDLPFQVGDLILVRVLDPKSTVRNCTNRNSARLTRRWRTTKNTQRTWSPIFLWNRSRSLWSNPALMMRENSSGYVRVIAGRVQLLGVASHNRATPGSSVRLDLPLSR